jgi:hypothetical protein
MKNGLQGPFFRIFFSDVVIQTRNATDRSFKQFSLTQIRQNYKNDVNPQELSKYAPYDPHFHIWCSFLDDNHHVQCKSLTEESIHFDDIHVNNYADQGQYRQRVNSMEIRKNAVFLYLSFDSIISID